MRNRHVRRGDIKKLEILVFSNPPKLQMVASFLIIISRAVNRHLHILKLKNIFQEYLLVFASA